MKFLKVSTGGGDEKANRWSAGDDIFCKYCHNLLDRKESDIILSLMDYLRCPRCGTNHDLEYQDIMYFDEDNKPLYLFHCYKCNIDLMSNELIVMVI